MQGPKCFFKQAAPRNKARCIFADFWDVTVSSPITEEAVRIINAAPKNGPLDDPIAYASALPAEAAGLAQVLRSGELAKVSEKYRKCDKQAMGAQKGFNLVALGAACSGFLATVVGGVLFYAGSGATPPTVIYTLWILQFLFLAISLIALLVLYLWKPFRTWRARRSDAEIARIGFYSRLVGAPAAPGDALLLPLKLECFRRHLFDDQMKWFKKRGEDKRREARRWRRLSWIAGLLTALGSVPQVVAFVKAFDQPGLFFEILGQLTSLLPGEKRLYAFAWFIGLQVTALVAVIAMTSRSADLGKTYRREFKFLDRYQPYLPDAREAAAIGQPGPVNMFTHTVSIRLAETVEDWASQEEGLGFP
jgi:hypothetical protein